LPPLELVQTPTDLAGVLGMRNEEKQHVVKKIIYRQHTQDDGGGHHEYCYPVQA
jgi:hypothetical protein